MGKKAVLVSSRVWAKLTPDERESVLMENGLPLNSSGLSLADVNDFLIVLNAFQLKGVSRQQFGTLTVEIPEVETPPQNITDALGVHRLHPEGVATGFHFRLEGRGAGLERLFVELALEARAGLV